MNTEVPINNNYLGADTSINPEALALLKTAGGKEANENGAGSASSGPDEYEQIFGV